MIKRYRMLSLAVLVLVTATAVLLAHREPDGESDRPTAISGSVGEPAPPSVEVDPDSANVEVSSATPRRASARIAAPADEAIPDDRSGLPGTQPGSYELAGPGDRTPAPPPDFFRALGGSFDDSNGAPLFASICSYSHSRPDDPMVYPRQPGASHLHDFFGNKQTDAFSTDDSLRTGGETTCTNFPGDTAAYWVPALYEDGFRVEPRMLTAYYAAGSKNPKSVEPFPRGLKILVKDAQAAKWHCSGQVGGPGSTNPQHCPSDEHVVLQLVFPDCWDGKYLDVPDHRAHMSYADGQVCPRSHPVPVPQLVLYIDYMDARGGDVRLAPLSNPSSPHADFVNSWDQAMLTKFVRDCINSGVHCGGKAP